MRNIPSHLVAYFRGDVLALYANQPDRYTGHTDYFSGSVETSSEHYERFARESRQNLLDVRFGFRTLRNGDLALAVFMPDLAKASDDEKRKWLGCAVSNGELAPEPDERFDMWVDRYIDGSWNVENGVLAQLGLELRAANAVTFCTVGLSVFGSEDYESLSFPSAQNNLRYHDAHSEVYKFLIDGLSREALKKLAERLNVAVPPRTERTLKLLGYIVDESIHDDIFPAFEIVSQNRRLAGHERRPPAAPMKAFEHFNADMKAVVKALSVLKEHLAERFDVTVESCMKRKEALNVLHPGFDEQLTVEPNYSICDITKVVGKRIINVEMGFRKQIEGVHDSELIILHFDDGSSIAIDTGSNAGNLASMHKGFKPEDLNVRFQLTYVPPLEPRKAPETEPK